MVSRLLKLMPIWLLLCGLRTYAQTDIYDAVSNSRVRALSMGGTFTATAQGPAAVFLNPATLHFFQPHAWNSWAIILNPLASGAVWKYFADQTENHLSRTHWGEVAKVLPWALVIGNQNWELALVNHEGLATAEPFRKNIDVLEGDGFLQNHAEGIAVRLRLAEQVYIGGAIQYYHAFSQDSLRHGMGASYGVFVRPHPKVNIGIFFLSLPGKMEEIRRKYDRLEDESVNVGFAYRPFLSTTIAVDVRNLTEETNFNTRELHIGIEQALFRHLQLRAGYFFDRELKKNRFSVGLGMIHPGLLGLGETEILPHQMLLNYGLQVEADEPKAVRHHFISVSIGFAW